VPGAPLIQWLAEMQAISIFAGAMWELCQREKLGGSRGAFKKLVPGDA